MGMRIKDQSLLSYEGEKDKTQFSLALLKGWRMSTTKVVSVEGWGEMERASASLTVLTFFQKPHIFLQSFQFIFLVC